MTDPQPTAIEQQRIIQLVDRAAALPDVRAEVEANHDNNRWWPTNITDPRMRMLAAGWSTRISYRMISIYADVIAQADAMGFDALAGATNSEVTHLVRPLGLAQARLDYLRSLNSLIEQWAKDGTDPSQFGQDDLIQQFADKVHGASYKVAQCAVLYVRGYHCGVIPVDSGMVTKLAPALGIRLPSGSIAHERMRHTLQGAVSGAPCSFREMARRHRHAVTIPLGVSPTWWVHLVLIYFKRLYLNGPSTRLCINRPLCAQSIDCAHVTV